MEAMFRRGGRGGEGFLQEGQAHALGSPTWTSVAGVQGFPFTISAKRASRTEMILPSWARSATAWSRNCSWSGVSGSAAGPSAPYAPEGGQHLARVPEVEQVNGARSHPRPAGFPGRA